MLAYSVYFSDKHPGDCMYTLATDEAKGRVYDSGQPEMYAPLIKDGEQRAFHLLKKSTSVSEPVRKRDIVKIFGTDDDVDLLENLIDRAVYERRTITEEFVLLGQNAESGNIYPADRKEWAGLISELKNYFNSVVGQQRIVLSEDPGFYWVGRIAASIAEMEKHRAVVRITAEVEPYKYERYSSVQDWFWDDFSFIDGIIRDYRNIPISHDEGQYMTLLVPMRTRDVAPDFLREVGSSDDEDDVQVSIDGEHWYDCAFSSWTAIPEIRLAGARKITDRYLYFKGNGHKINVRMRGATL